MELMQDQNSQKYVEARRRMVDGQIAARGIKDERILKAFDEVPRHLFVTKDLRDDAYEDHPLPIGLGQTISQPYIVALMTSQLDLKGNEKVLEIGTGSGYQAAILASLAAEVHSVERIEKLAVSARKILEENNFRNVAIHVGDGSMGWPDAAPYDDILVTAASPEVPGALLDQLKVGGKLIIPVGARWRQVLELWEKKSDSRTTKKEILPVVFVPLKGKFGWQDGEH
jgi:protein-L-isoaspartate(D-aspartate) O-methyltransferase